MLNFPRITLIDEFVDVLNRSLDLSSDQKYLRDILIIISTGIIPVNFENRSPGKIGYARWLTTANRVLRLYITCISPSDDLCIITSYIVNVYARMWFNIKYKSTLKYGAIHLYNLICYSRSLSNDTIDCCIKHTLKINAYFAHSENTIKMNAYFAHSENILFAMLNDDDNSIRKIAIERIIKAREHEDMSLIRKFKIPIVNFDALSYHTIITYNED